MAAYELFAATTTDLFIANIKAKAEAYGWTIDFFGLYNTHNRLHLHNADGAHFEIWYYSTTVAYIRGCTGYSPGDIPTAQPGVSGSCAIFSSLQHFIVIGSHSIYLKIFGVPVGYVNIQFGYISDKVGSWAGGICISTTQTSSPVTSAHLLWHGLTVGSSQVLINNGWSSTLPSALGGVKGICESELFAKMPFAYSGGIIPVPLLLVQIDPATISYLHPIGYAPDVMYFNGGNVYDSLQEITINAETWLAINQSEQLGTFNGVPDTLIRLAN